jgi:hypothetical protein
MCAILRPVGFVWNLRALRIGLQVCWNWAERLEGMSPGSAEAAPDLVEGVRRELELATQALSASAAQHIHTFSGMKIFPY